MGEVIDITEYLRIKKNLEKEGKPVDNLPEKIERIRASIERLDKLMKDLKEGK